ncbi:hypothetical protein [uncultured Amnibacterium sp.]|uniref:FitA-like ribbon-helix-helix domain-containing protein n=1 Tax=uncultured Amnibacterium sp. TaxID=1631851 RepID=UPI0035CAD506
MVSMTIRNLPAVTRDRLAERAERAGQSLQEYMRALLVDTATAPTVDEWLEAARATARGSGVRLSAEEYVAAARSGRSGVE